MFIIIDKIPYHYVIEEGYIALVGCKDSVIFRHPPKDAEVYIDGDPVVVEFCARLGMIRFHGTEDPLAVTAFLEKHIQTIDDEGWHAVEHIN